MPRLTLRSLGCARPRSERFTGPARSIAGLPALVLLTAAAGCRDDARIVQYSVPKEPVARAAPFAAQTADAAGKRMLAAILPGPQRSWFFKVTGVDEAVAGEQARVVAFLKTVKIESDDPPKVSWTLPENWNEQPGDGIRYATIELATADPPLELTVTMLETAGELDEYVLQNVNRWRGQMGLDSIDSAKPSEELSVLEAGEQEIILVNLAGAPAVASASTSAPNSGPADSPKAAGPLAYDTPEGWTTGPSRGIRKAAFGVTAGEEKVEITVIDLPPSDWLQNVNRWRGQVQLPPMTAEQLAAETEEIDVDGLTGQYVELIGPADAARRESIQGVMVVRGNKAWFFKLKGDAALAAREKERFKSFVRSVRFSAEE